MVPDHARLGVQRLCGPLLVFEETSPDHVLNLWGEASILLEDRDLSCFLAFLRFGLLPLQGMPSGEQSQRPEAGLLRDLTSCRHCHASVPPSLSVPERALTRTIVQVLELVGKEEVAQHPEVRILLSGDRIEPQTDLRDIRNLF